MYNGNFPHFRRDKATDQADDKWDYYFVFWLTTSHSLIYVYIALSLCVVSYIYM